MERTVAQIQFPAAPLPRLTRVAAYARVSSGKDAMLHSLSAQVSYYSDMIQKHPGWQYAGVYADEAITGTKDAREGFQRLLAACRAGEVDMVITKSISRLARNTVTLLGTVRELKGLGVDVMLHSLSAQVSYYSDMIQKHPGWQYAGVYADEAITGTKDAREGFQRFLAACRAGEVDMVITKSISRLARNTVTLLGTVRELKGLGVDVYFEEQNIHTMSADGELMMTILASYAQEESRSASENQLWRIRRNFEAGVPWNGTMLGYRYDHGTLVVVPEEAAIVRTIFSDYLAGMGTGAIVKKLNAAGVRTRNGHSWCRNGVRQVLKNEAYTGGLLLQKTFRENCITKRTNRNEGQLPQYRVQDSHEAIIQAEQFAAVQAEMQRRANQCKNTGKRRSTYPFSGMVVCGICGARYRRKMNHGKPIWVCSRYNLYGKAACPDSKAVPEDVLTTLANQVAPLGEITAIRAERDNTLAFTLADGSEIVKRWQDRSRSESWTDEMREQARRKTIERNSRHA